MILQALYKYYKVAPDMPPYGMKYQAIPFIIVIDEDGKFVRLEDTRSDKEKKGRLYLLPKSDKKTSNAYENPNVLWGNGLYVLGLSSKKDKNKVEKYFFHFIDKIKDIKEYLKEDKGVNAVWLFYQDPKQLEALLNSKIYLESIKGKEDDFAFSFRLVSEKDHSVLVANSPLNEMVGYLVEQRKTVNPSVGICVITGEKTNICRLHESIEVYGGTNAGLITFQKDSGVESYGKSQGENAPISIIASNAIHSALNTLLRRGENTNYILSGITYVFWSTLTKSVVKIEGQDSDMSLEEAYRRSTFNFPHKKDDETYKNRSKKLLQALKAITQKKGVNLDLDGEAGRFYILGLSPNQGRISVVLWKEGPIPEIIGNTIQHLQDMNIIDEGGNLDEETPPLQSIRGIVRSISKPSKLRKETNNKSRGETDDEADPNFPYDGGKKKEDESDKWSKLMVKNIIRSVVCNLPYPREMQLACLDRIRATRGVTTLRVAILKAYLNRSKTNKYHITMALDKTNTESAYLLGRLFALLEGAQSAALKNNLNATIRDRYYGAASTAPASTFVQLIKLYGAHLSKLRKETHRLAKFYDKRVEEVFSLLPASKFPPHLNADEQSLFAIGYYHEKVDLYNNKTKTEDNE